MLSFSFIFIRQVCYQTIPPNMKRTAGLLENQMAAVVLKHVLEGLYSLHFFFFIKNCVGCGMILRHKTPEKKKNQQKKSPRGMWVGEWGTTWRYKKKTKLAMSLNLGDLHMREEKHFGYNNNNKSYHYKEKNASRLQSLRHFTAVLWNRRGP